MDYTLAEYIPETFDLLAFNGALKKLVGLFLWLWRRQSRYISTHDACKHRDAIAADPAFYETWLRPKYDEFCATRGWAGAPGPALRPDGDDGDGGAEPPDD